MLKQLQETLVQVQQFSQSLTFSTTYKYSNCSVTQNGKVLETSSGCWQCCMCDQMIPKNGLIQFAIQLLKFPTLGQELVLGILCRVRIMLVVIVSQYLRRVYQDINSSKQNIQYILRWSLFNHDQQDKYSKSIAFPFSTNDIIIVEEIIQKKYMKWTKQSTNRSFTLDIDTAKDLYPCVHLQSIYKVEILNQVFKLKYIFSKFIHIYFNITIIINNAQISQIIHLPQLNIKEYK